METKIDEIGAGIYRLSIFAPEVAAPAGLTFNHFPIIGDEALLFHCGLRKMFPLVSAAVATIMPVKQLRWLGFGHVEADECGSMNEWLAAAPAAQLAHGMLCCRVSVNDLADRPPRALSDGEVIDIGGKRLATLIRRMLVDTKPKVLAAMHGPSFSGDGAAALKTLGDHYDTRLRAMLAA